MFPWTDGFHWTATHIIFLSLFFAALLTTLSPFVSSLWRTAGDFRKHRATAMCWRETFEALLPGERTCPHQLAGRVASRRCDNAFDCRSCPNYEKFAALPISTPPKTVGVNYSDKLLYHRGHTRVRPEWDGTYSVGLDEFAQHLLGQPDSVKLPAVCDELESDGAAWSMTKNGHKVHVRAPLSGTVIAVGGPDKEFYVKPLPHGEANLQHLLRGPEVAGRLASEVDRLQLQLSAPNAPPCLADSGALMLDLMNAEPNGDWENVLADTFLES
jgi:Glycine cleavage H-protein